MIQPCAYIDLAAGVVVNTIVADPETDVAPEGYLIVPLPAGVGIGWLWDGETFHETPEMIAVREAAEAAEAALPWNVARVELETDPQAFLLTLVHPNG